MLKSFDFFNELKLRRDTHIADFGCGVGENSKTLSELVVDGKVFAVDVHKDLLEHLELDILKEKRKQDKVNIENNEGHVLDNILYQNIIPVWGNIEDLDGTRLRDDSIDCILISNTFFLLKHKKTCILEMKRVLRKFGKILFIDWHKPLGQSVMHKASILPMQEIIKMFSELDLFVEKKLFSDDNHFVLLIEKR